MIKTTLRDTIRLFKKFHSVANLDSDVSRSDARLQIFPSILPCPMKTFTDLYDAVMSRNGTIMGMEQIKMMMKKLTRIRPINRHYFVNDDFGKWFFSISGENYSREIDDHDDSAGPDHQSMRFNTSSPARESSRNLKGYELAVKLNEGNAYLRKGSVIFHGTGILEEKQAVFYHRRQN